MAGGRGFPWATRRDSWMVILVFAITLNRNDHTISAAMQIPLFPPCLVCNAYLGSVHRRAGGKYHP
jgi:hypothetical protein